MGLIILSSMLRFLSSSLLWRYSAPFLQLQVFEQISFGSLCSFSSLLTVRFLVPCLLIVTTDRVFYSWLSCWFVFYIHGKTFKCSFITKGGCWVSFYSDDTGLVHVVCSYTLIRQLPDFSTCGWAFVSRSRLEQPGRNEKHERCLSSLLGQLFGCIKPELKVGGYDCLARWFQKLSSG